MKTYEEMAESVFLKIHEYNKRKEERKQDTLKAVGVISVLFILISASINIFIPAYARELPVLGSAFAFIQDKLDFMGVYTDYAFHVGEKAESNGVTIEISEVYCDGTNLFISYVIEGEDLFALAQDGDFNTSQIDCHTKIYYTNEGTRTNLDDVCLDVEKAGLEGEFLNNSTFTGAKTYCLKNSEFPDDFMLNVTIDSISFFGKGDLSIKGNWKFSVKVACNYEDIVVYDVDKEKDQHSIDKIIVSPIMITVYSSYPDIYSGTVRYMLVAYSDIYPDENITSLGEFPPGSGITKIPRSRVGNVLDIYVYDRASFDKNEDPSDRGNIEKHAIVSTHLNLQ